MRTAITANPQDDQISCRNLQDRHLHAGWGVYKHVSMPEHWIVVSGMNYWIVPAVHHGFDSRQNYDGPINGYLSPIDPEQARVALGDLVDGPTYVAIDYPAHS